MRTRQMNAPRSRSVFVLVVATAGCAAAPAENRAPATAPDIGLAGHNPVANATFDDGTSLPWMTSFSAPGDGKASVDDGALCLHIGNKGTNAWDAQVRHREMVIKKGHKYTVHFKAYSSAPTKVRPKLGMIGPPYIEHW